MKLGRRQGFNFHAEGRIVFLSDFQKLGYWHMLKLSQSDAPAWDFESGMNGANIYFACGEVFRVQSGDNGGDRGCVVRRALQEWQLGCNQAVSGA